MLMQQWLTFPKGQIHESYYLNPINYNRYYMTVYKKLVSSVVKCSQFTYPSVDAVTIATLPSSRDGAFVAAYILPTVAVDFSRVEDPPNSLRRISSMRPMLFLLSI